MDDETLSKSIVEDPFHVGLAEHGEFRGFRKDKRTESGPRLSLSLSDEEIKASRSKLARLVRNPQLLLVVAYIGTILLMGKVYA